MSAAELGAWLLTQSLSAGWVVVVMLLVERFLCPGVRIRLLLWTAACLHFLLPAPLKFWSLAAPPSGYQIATGGLSLPEAPFTGPSLQGGLLCLWALGVAFCAWRFLRARAIAVGLVRHAQPAPASWVQDLGALCSDAFLTPTLLFSDVAPGPFAFGLRRPRIVIPSRLADVPGRQRAMILAHELAHLSARHDVWLLLEGLVCSLFFFHPLAWVAARRARLARELVCDARAVDRTGEAPHFYARTLLSTAAASPGMVAALSRQGRALEIRLRALVRPQASPQAWRALVALACGTLAVMAIPATEAPQQAHAFDNPLPGARLTSPFGQRIHPILTRPEHHPGVDLAAPAGTPVRAPASGRVRTASARTADHTVGFWVEVDHGDGVSTAYHHLDTVLVGPDQPINAGEVLGTVGSTGQSTGDHLHFEVRVGGEPADPARFALSWAEEKERS